MALLSFESVRTRIPSKKVIVKAIPSDRSLFANLNLENSILVCALNSVFDWMSIRLNSQLARARERDRERSALKRSRYDGERKRQKCFTTLLYWPNTQCVLHTVCSTSGRCPVSLRGTFGAPYRHDQCFLIQNSVRSEILISPVLIQSFTFRVTHSELYIQTIGIKISLSLKIAIQTMARI